MDVDVKPEERPGDVPPSEISGHQAPTASGNQALSDIPIKKHQGNAVLNHHISLFNAASLSSPVGLAVLLPCVAVDLPP